MRDDQIKLPHRIRVVINIDCVIRHDGFKIRQPEVCLDGVRN
jgi:hypothetical protein